VSLGASMFFETNVKSVYVYVRACVDGCICVSVCLCVCGVRVCVYVQRNPSTYRSYRPQTLSASQGVLQCVAGCCSVV